MIFRLNTVVSGRSSLMDTEALKALFLDPTESDKRQGISAAERVYLDTLGTFVSFFFNEENMVGAGVYAPKTGGFRVIIKDLDAGLSFVAKCVPDLTQAETYAQKCVA